MPTPLPLLRNVYLWTQRRTLAQSTQQTQGATGYLTAVPAHLEPNTANNYVTLPDAAFRAAYYCVVASGTNIAVGDYLSKITLDQAGNVPWPNEMASQIGAPGASNTVWTVVYVRETAARLLPAREVWIDRDTTGGKAHL